MNNKPVDLQQMFRRALLAQVDIGMDEIVLDRVAPTEGISLQPAETLNQTIPVEVALKTERRAGLPVEITKLPDFDSLSEHKGAICECQNCALGATRIRFVYGVGNPKADIMFIGEAPGADEDAQGEPFVGRAGKLLTKIIEAMGLSRDQIYIANMLKCRPPGNRDPLPQEMDQCMGYLREQIRLIQPKVICLLGRIAAQGILNTKTPLGKLRNDWHRFEGIPVIVTYHPAALLRFSSYKKDTWADMQELLRFYKELQLAETV